MVRVLYQTRERDEDGNDLPGARIPAPRFRLLLEGFDPLAQFTVTMNKVGGPASEIFAAVCDARGNHDANILVTVPAIQTVFASIGAYESPRSEPRRQRWRVTNNEISILIERI